MVTLSLIYLLFQVEYLVPISVEFRIMLVVYRQIYYPTFINKRKVLENLNTYFKFFIKAFVFIIK